MFSILIVEDDRAIREMLEDFLTSKKFAVTTAHDGDQTLKKLYRTPVDLILLDWMLPDTSGPSLIKTIRKNEGLQNTPIIMLTAKAEELDKIEGLTVGADDYMTKPVSLQELNARIHALIRRSQGLNEKNIIQKGSISLDPDNNIVTISGHEVTLGQTEYRLLHFLMKNTGRLYSRSQLLDQVWGQGTFIEERTVDVHILRLRKILKPYNVDKMIQTVRGAGYKFKVDA